MADVLLTQKQGSVYIARINRPDALNALNFEVMDRMAEMIGEIETDDDIRVFILEGSGQRYFASGGDLREFSSLKTSEEGREMAAKMGRILQRIEDVPCWTIACLNGDAYGGGSELSLAFDFRIAAEHSQFHFNQSQFYLTPGWGGLTRLVERVGRSCALEWLATGRPVTAREALVTGLINHSFSGDQLEREVQRLSELMARNDRHLIRALKEGAERAIQIERSESLEAELEAFARLWGSSEHHNRVEQFLNRKNG